MAPIGDAPSLAFAPEMRTQGIRQFGNRCTIFCAVCYEAIAVLNSRH